MENKKIADVFSEIADILELQGANKFRVLAYRKAAQTILDLGHDVGQMYKDDHLQILKIPGIGKELALKIGEIIKTGKCLYLEELLKGFDEGLLELLKVRGLGPKKVMLINKELGVKNVAELIDVAKKGELRKLSGLGEKSELEILKAAQKFGKSSERILINQAFEIATSYIEYMKKCGAVEKIEFAGSLRRGKDTIGDIDILCSGKNNKLIAKHFVDYKHVKKVLGIGETKCSVLLSSGIQVDLRIIDKKLFGAALHYFTGSKEHNVRIRDMAKKNGLKVSEYGVFRIEDGELIAGETEEEIYQTLGMKFVIPELRENRGEIEASLTNRLPKVINLADLRGDLHVHSNWSDGNESIEEMARVWRNNGLKYMAITDHSPAVRIANGLDPKKFREQWLEIDRVNEVLKMEEKMGEKTFKVLKGVECDILGDGKLDLPDEILKEMDVVIGSIHSKFALEQEEQTERVLKAFRNPYLKIWGHPTGRLIGKREPINLNLEKLLVAAKAFGVVIEIDSQEERMDLNDVYCKLGKEIGVKFCIDSDAHSSKQIRNLRFGIGIARRGWVEKEDVVNCFDVNDFLKNLRK